MDYDEKQLQLAGKEDKLRVYTTRPDTLFGATYMVISPEHPYIDLFKDDIENYGELIAYREEAAKKQYEDITKKDESK